MGDTVFAHCDFFVLPAFSPKRLFGDGITAPSPVTIQDLPRASGRLCVSLNSHIGTTGSFKTAHHGGITFDTTCNIPDTFAPFLATTPDSSGAIPVAVKQVKQSHGNKKQYIRLAGTQEFNAIWPEVLCLLYASALFQVATEWMNAQDVDEIWHPDISFVHAMLAICQQGSIKRIFLIEELLENSEMDPFVKFVHNTNQVPSSNLFGSRAEIAEYLCFIQHVQYEATKQTSFVSDWQGLFLLALSYEVLFKLSSLGTIDHLTDPQILTNW